MFEPTIADHQGRIFKLVGDGLLAEFGSVVEADQCAIELQRGMSNRYLETPEEQRIEVRIGINLGDVIIEGDDRHGDGVNVAARLESLSDPGGVLISGTAFDQVEGKLDCEFEFLGEQRVKNIEKPVRLYRVKPGKDYPAKVAAVTGRPRGTQFWLAISAALLILMVGGLAIWSNLLDGFKSPIEVATESKMEFPLPDKPSIAVLPFDNMSDVLGQEHFADGMTDDLITDLSKISGLFVISRNSTFVYKGKAVKFSEVAEDLGVRYILEGSVQRAGDRLRVNAQLIDALTGGHVWADRFDGKADDIFSVQDSFVRKIVEALEVHLTKGEIEEITRAKTASITAKEAFDEGWSLYLRFNAQDNFAAIGPLEKAIELDPEYGRAYAALVLVYFRIGEYLWFQEFGMDLPAGWYEVLRRAEYYLQLARKYPTALAYAVEAQDHIHYGRAEDAVRDAGRAIALDPNDPEAHITMAWAFTISGKPNDALNFVDTAIRLNPNYPSHYVLARGIALFAADDLKQATQVLDEGLKRNPQAVALLPPLASLLAQLGRREEARQALQTWRPGADQATFANLWYNYTFPFRWKSEYAHVRERLYDGLRVAGMPLDVTVSSLLAELKQGDLIDRRYTVQRLGWFGPAAAPAVPALIELLGDEYFRQDAVQSLGKIGPAAKAAIPALEELQYESLIGYYAKEALKEIKSSD